VWQTACNIREWRQCKTSAEKVRSLGNSSHTTLSTDLKIYCICQHNVPRMLMQEQCNDHIRSFSIRSGKVIKLRVFYTISEVNDSLYTEVTIITDNHKVPAGLL